MKDYPHLDDTSFPDLDNEQVYKYKNNFDYSRWKPDVTLHVCNVPWDEGYKDVVKFEDDSKRDAWFDSLDSQSIELQTMFHALLETEVKLPVPYQDLAYRNYIVTQFDIPTSAGEPIEYATSSGKKRFFYFIDSMESLAPNSTLVRLKLDVWTTYINDTSIQYMMLNRGHAPMKAISADSYLGNPIRHNEYLKAPDVVYGEPAIAAFSKELIVNEGGMWALFIITGDARGSWGTVKNETGWRVAFDSFYDNDGNMAYGRFGIPLDDLKQFILDLDDEIPQFKQTVQAVFIMPDKLVTKDNSRSFTLAGHTCWSMDNSNQRTFELVDLDKQMFGFDDKYAGIAKLYTYPYSALEVVNEHGQKFQVHIEDTVGTVELNLATNYVFPQLKLDGWLTGIGGTNKQSLSFKTLITTRHMSISGRWYDFPMDWNIPTFQIGQSANDVYDFGTYWDRQQAKHAYENTFHAARNSALADRSTTKASATTAKNNAYTDSGASYNNALDESSLGVLNASAQNATDTAIVSYANTIGAMSLSFNNGLLTALQRWNADLGNKTVATENWAEGWSTAINAAGSVVGGAATGGAYGAITGGITAACSAGTTALSVWQRDTVQSYTNTNTENTRDEYQQNNIDNTRLMIGGSTSGGSVTGTNKYNVDKANALRTYNASTAQKLVAGGTVSGGPNNVVSTFSGTAKRSYEAAKDVADATKDTAHDNADLIYNYAYGYSESRDGDYSNARLARDTAQEAIQNGIRQAKLDAPSVYGHQENGDTFISRPMMVQASVLRQSDGDIAMAGDAMLRYGYTFNRQWAFKGFNVMDAFTYWKAEDVWLDAGTNALEGAKQGIRDIISKGVTVWRKPEQIGSVSIYDNGI